MLSACLVLVMIAIFGLVGWLLGRTDIRLSDHPCDEQPRRSA